MQVSLFPYPGGKTGLRQKIVQFLTGRLNPTIEEYREPFVGGGSVALHFVETHPKIPDVWLNDRDAGVASAWQATRDAPAELRDLVDKFEPTVAAFSEYKQRLTSTLSVPDELAAIAPNGFEKIALHRISYSSLGTMAGGPRGGYKQTTTAKIDARWQRDKVGQRIGEVHDLLVSRNTRITNQDFEEVIRDASRPAIIYCDPPYWHQGNALYQHGFSYEDHERLAGALRETLHQWVLSYDDCEEVRNLYGWAHITTISVRYSVTKSRTETELLIVPDRSSARSSAVGDIGFQ
jgi:DNA adenine methylase